MFDTIDIVQWLSIPFLRYYFVIAVEHDTLRILAECGLDIGQACNSYLTHWDRMTHIHICVSKLTIIGSDNGLSPGRRQAIIWTNAGLLLIGPLGKNFNEMLMKIRSFSFKKMRLKVSSAKWRPIFLGLNESTNGHGLTCSLWDLRASSLDTSYWTIGWNSRIVCRWQLEFDIALVVCMENCTVIEVFHYQFRFSMTYHYPSLAYSGENLIGVFLFAYELGIQ